MPKTDLHKELIKLKSKSKLNINLDFDPNKIQSDRLFHIDDIKKIAKPVLRHRIILNFNAEAEGIKTDDILEKLINV